MLGKLLKHEWKSTWKIGAILLGCLAAITLVGCISLRMPFIYNAMSGETGMRFGFLDFMGMISLVLYILALVGASYALIIYLGVHFYRSMYTDEGYLTHTLPVTVNQILISKILNGVLWTLLIGISIIASVVILGCTALCLYMNETPAGVAAFFADIFLSLVSEMPPELTGDLTHMTISCIIMLILSPLSSIIVLYGSITLGQLFTKHRGLMAIVCYILVCIVNSILGTVIAMPMSLRYMVEAGRYQDGSIAGASYLLRFYASSYDASIILALIMGAGLYTASYLILTKKFDIE